MTAHAINPSNNPTPLRTDADGNLLVNFGAGGSSSVIKSIQTGIINIAGTLSSGTASITAVNTSKSFVIFNGQTAGGAPSISDINCSLVLTNSTTVTSTRGTSNGNVSVYFTVVEFN